MTADDGLWPIGWEMPHDAYGRPLILRQKLDTKDTTMTDWKQAKEAAVVAMGHGADWEDNFDRLKLALDTLKAHGYVVVPEKPIDEMLDAGYAVDRNAATPRNVYTAMIKAAQANMK